MSNEKKIQLNNNDIDRAVPGSACGCPPKPCTCPPGSCTCPPGSCTCPPGSCTCPPGSCTCPPGSCTCPTGTCPHSIELVQNPSFEIACTSMTCNVFASWNGTNIAENNSAPLTGDAAALLGNSRPNDASLEQTIPNLIAGCPYKFNFSINAQNLSNGNGRFEANVFWLPSNTPAINPAINPIVIDRRFSGNNYVFIQRITNLPPANTTGARILFRKIGTGSVLIDDVSLYR